MNEISVLPVPHCANTDVFPVCQWKKSTLCFPATSHPAGCWLCSLCSNKVSFWRWQEAVNRGLNVVFRLFSCESYFRCICVHSEFFQSKCTCSPSRLGTEVTGPLNLGLVFLVWIFFFGFYCEVFFCLFFFFRFYFAPLYWAQYCEWMRCDFGGNVKHEKCYFLDTCCFFVWYRFVFLCIVFRLRQFDSTKLVTFLQDGNKFVM